MSRNREYEIQPRGKTSFLFHCCDTNVPLEIIIQGGDESCCKYDVGFVDRETHGCIEKKKERERESPPRSDNVARDRRGGSGVGSKEVIEIFRAIDR